MLYNKILENLGIFNFIENSLKRQLVNIRNNAPQFDKSWGSRDSSSWNVGNRIYISPEFNKRFLACL